MSKYILIIKGVFDHPLQANNPGSKLWYPVHIIFMDLFLNNKFQKRQLDGKSPFGQHDLVIKFGVCTFSSPVHKANPQFTPSPSQAYRREDADGGKENLHDSWQLPCSSACGQRPQSDGARVPAPEYHIQDSANGPGRDHVTKGKIQVNMNLTYKHPLAYFRISTADVRLWASSFGYFNKYCTGGSGSWDMVWRRNTRTDKRTCLKHKVQILQIVDQ